MKYLLERLGKTMVVEVPTAARFAVEGTVTSSGDAEMTLLTVSVFEEEKLIGVFGQVTAFYSEDMEPRKQEFI